jgi:hypothetical protein
MNPRTKPRKTAKKGPPCRVCASVKRETIENAIRRGGTTAEIANTYGLGRKSIRTHAEKHMVPPVMIAEERAPVATVVTLARPADASPLERARLNADEALSALQRGEATNLPSRDIARLRDSLTNAEKFYAQLASSRALTPEAIVRTAGWAALVAEVTEALKPWPEASRAVLAAMRA